MYKFCTRQDMKVNKLSIIEICAVLWAKNYAAYCLEWMFKKNPTPPPKKINQKIRYGDFKTENWLDVSVLLY